MSGDTSDNEKGPAGDTSAGSLFLGLTPPDLEIDAQGTPRSGRYGDLYYQPGAGLAESRHNYLFASGFPDRWRGAERLVIAELGFGTGLNFLSVWQALADDPARPRHVTYIGVEAHPMGADDAARCHGAFPELAPFADALRRAWPAPIKGVYHHHWPDAGLTLQLWQMPVETALAGLEITADVWFLDGFAPARNRDMWSPGVLAHIGRLSAPGAIASTFSVAGAVRRGLEAAGFTVHKCPGFGAKRERLEAVLARPDAPSSSAAFARCPQKIAIIGGGIAGAACARAARAAGLQIGVYDGGMLPAASANKVALVMPRLDRDDTPMARLHRTAFAHACRLYAAAGDAWNACGVRLRAQTPDELARLHALAAAQALPRDWLQPVDDGVVMPMAGTLDPQRLRTKWLEGAELLAAQVTGVDRDGDGWVVSCGEHEARYDTVIMCGGMENVALHPLLAQALRGSAGEVGYLPGVTVGEVVVDGRYVAPDGQGGLVFGATHARWHWGDAPPVSTPQGRASNCAALRELTGVDAAESQMNPRASVRATTAARQPVMGPIANPEGLADWAAPLATGQQPEGPPPRLPGLYALTGLGSRGFTTAPLLADALIADIVGRPAPLEAGARAAMHPVRFIMRAARRGQ